MRVVLFLFFVLPLVSAQAGTNYYGMVPVAALLAASIVAVAYMLSHLLQNSQMESWAKIEWKELVIAGITVALAYSAISVSQGAILGATAGYYSESALVSSIEAKFNSMTANFTNDYYHVIKTGHRLGMLSSYFYTKAGGYIFNFGVSNSPYIGVGGGLLQTVTILAGNLSTGILIYHTMVLFLKFFFSTAITYILPLGLALRLIPFTRSIGGTLIGLALAGIFVYPFAMVFAAEIHDSIGIGHSQLTSDDFESMRLKLSSFLVELCTNDYIRIFTSINEWGWWLIICIPYCAIEYAVNMATCSANYGLCTIPCTGPQAGLCLTACTTVYTTCQETAFTTFDLCWPPITGLCWDYSYQFYNDVQKALMNAASVVLVTSSGDISNAMGANGGELYDIVMDKLVIPVSGASAVPIMEGVFVGALTIVGARALSSALAGEMSIPGLERLI